MLNLFDTQSGAMKPVQAEDGKQLRFYCCGPTVYAAAHIGNFRTFVVQDVFRRVTELGGLRTKHVRNITDVDDKTIRNSQAQGMELGAYTAKWTDKFHADCKALNCLVPHVEPSAVGHIKEQLEIVQLLMDKGHAYQSEDGSVYFRISSYPEYGRLAHLDRQTLDQLQEMGYAPVALRYVLAGAYYRRPLNFTLAGMKDATSALNKLGRFDKALASVMFNGAFTEHDFVSPEAHFADNHNSLHEIEKEIELTGYYIHDGKRFSPFFDFGMRQSIDQGHNNDLAGFGDLGIYTKLTDNSGITIDLALSHASSTGQRIAATLNMEYGYRFNDRLGVIVGLATLLRDSGKHTHNDTPYDRGRWSTAPALYISSRKR